VIGGCGTDSGDPVLVRYLARNLSDVPVECVLTDSNGAVLGAPLGVGPLGSGFAGVVEEVGPLACSGALEAGEPDTATLSCQCVSGGASFPAIDTDQATIDCVSPCEVKVDKQVSCNKGNTWHDVGFDDAATGGCTMLQDGLFMYIRYVAHNPGTTAVTGCVLTDSNGAILPGPVAVGTLEAGFTGTVHDQAPFRCFDAQDELEPDTATLVCDCADGSEASSTDRAQFDCRDCDVDVDRQVSCAGGLTWQDTGYRDGQALGCSAANGTPVRVRYRARERSATAVSGCVLTDSNGAILPGPVAVGNLANNFDGVVHEAQLACSAALNSGGPDTVTLSCQCAPTCQRNCPLCANYCLPGAQPDVSASDTDQATLTCQ
jgi:hypothetical protein